MDIPFLELYDFILLVDDDMLTNRLNIMQLEKLADATEVLMADNGADALHILRKLCAGKRNQKILVFLDLEMPRVTGGHFLDFLPLVDELKNNEIDVVLASSKINSNEDEIIYTSPYIVGIYEKPVQIAQIQKDLLASKLKKSEL